MEKNEGHVVGGQKDSANELVSANTGWSAAAVSGFMAQCFVVASAVTLWKKKEIMTIMKKKKKKLLNFELCLRSRKKV